MASGLSATNLAGIDLGTAIEEILKEMAADPEYSKLTPEELATEALAGFQDYMIRYITQPTLTRVITRFRERNKES